MARLFPDDPAPRVVTILLLLVCSISLLWQIADLPHTLVWNEGRLQVRVVLRALFPIVAWGQVCLFLMEELRRVPGEPASRRHRNRGLGLACALLLLWIGLMVWIAATDFGFGRP